MKVMIAVLAALIVTVSIAPAFAGDTGQGASNADQNSATKSFRKRHGAE